jgi:hypothetical protein
VDGTPRNDREAPPAPDPFRTRRGAAAPCASGPDASRRERSRAFGRLVVLVATGALLVVVAALAFAEDAPTAALAHPPREPGSVATAAVATRTAAGGVPTALAATRTAAFAATATAAAGGG